MSLRRNADTKVVDERARRTRDSDRPDPGGGDRQTADGVAATPRPGGGAREEADRHGVGETRVSNREREGQGTTTLWRGGGAAPAGGRGPGRPAPDPMADPPVGWLVVVAGPGKGNVVTIGNGLNAIGRDRTKKVRCPLDFGDNMISRENHATITYDPRHRKFYVQHGGGTNLTYVDDKPVLEPRDLEPLAHVQMGNTVLRFVPLCGPGFSWEDEPDDR